MHGFIVFFLLSFFPLLFLYDLIYFTDLRASENPGREEGRRDVPPTAFIDETWHPSRGIGGGRIIQNCSSWGGGGTNHGTSPG
jgi:hypothetical protein